MKDQKKQSEWKEQWQMLEDNELFLFQDWIQPYTLESFRGKDVLECGCGGGQHTSFIAPYAKSITAVDLNAIDSAKKRNAQHTHIDYKEADIATMDLGKQFDIVFSIGVVHHTDSPEKTIANMKRHLKPGGLLLVWVYSKEGNELVNYVVEPIRKQFLASMSRPNLLTLSRIITALMYLPIYSLYLLPLTFLPYFDYFKNFRRLTYDRNVLNVFDKLNAPQVDFISRDRAHTFVSDMKEAKVLPYRGVSYSVSGVR